MPKVKILDCTLRDGGYVNDFDFGSENITNIISNLGKSGIEIIECGFLHSGATDPNKTLYDSVDGIKKHIVYRNDQAMYVAMIALGDISDDEITPCDGHSIQGIRVTFHEHQLEPAFLLGNSLQQKGYKVFMQPVGTTSYSDASLLHLVELINQMKPYAFYMVDTLGIMYKNDLLRMFYLIDHNLDESIAIGYHSHNNLQLAFSNAMELLQINSKREIIIDSSVFGMGRGAGNLCTELITQYINDNISKRYDVIPLLQIVDEKLNHIFSQTQWGYSIPYFIASSHQCHPNYATFLINKQTLSVKDIHKILKSMDDNERTLFNQSYINEKYIAYQKHNINDKESIKELIQMIGTKKVLVIAPGSSIDSYHDSISLRGFEEDTFVFSINFIPEFINVDALFVSNLKRFNSLEDVSEIENLKIPVVSTSNIPEVKAAINYPVNFSDYLNDDPLIVDNAGLMLLNLLKKLGVKNVILAGFDGFNIDGRANYYHGSSLDSMRLEEYEQRNVSTAARIKELSHSIMFEFATPSVYENI